MKEKAQSKELNKLYSNHRLLTGKKRTLEDISSYGGHSIRFTKSDRGDCQPAEVHIFANSNHEDMVIAHDIIKYAIRRYERAIKETKRRIDQLNNGKFTVYAYPAWSSEPVTHIFASRLGPCYYPDDHHASVIKGNFGIIATADIHNPIKLVTKEGPFMFCEASCRPATHEEIDLLMKKIKDEGLAWDNEHASLVPQERIANWEPEEDNVYWVCSYYGDRGFIPIPYIQEFAHEEELLKGWVYRSNVSCRKMCDRLNDALEDVEPFKERSKEDIE